MTIFKNYNFIVLKAKVPPGLALRNDFWLCFRNHVLTGIESESAACTASALPNVLSFNHKTAAI